MRFNFFRKEEPKMVQMNVPISNDDRGTVFASFALKSDYSKPSLTVNKSSNGYTFGDDNLYPQQLNNIYHSCGLHQSILDFKKLLTVGNGFSADTSTLNERQKLAYHALKLQLEDIMNGVAQDYFIHATVALELIFNDDHTKVIKVNRLPGESLRIENVDGRMKPLSFFYSYDWTQLSKYPKVRLPKYDPSNKTDKSQVFYFQVESPGMNIYSLPSYSAGIPWCLMNAQSAVWHTANIDQSLNPSVKVDIYRMPANKEEERNTLTRLNQSFAGAKNAGRAIVMWHQNKETASDFTQLEPNKLDKTFLSLSDTIQREICYSHKIDPIVLGLKTPGSLGQSSEWAYSFQTFTKGVISPAQKDLERIFNNIFQINGIPTQIKFNTVELVQPEKK